MTRLLMAICAMTLLALGSGMTTLVGTAQAQEATEVDISTVPDMVLGDENAPVTMIEYSSYTCPHCRNYHEGPFKQIKADYIDTGKVKYIMREAYFDRYGLWASMIARCEPEKFFGISDLVFKGQSEWLRAGGPAEVIAELRKIGRLAGISDEKLESCLTDAQQAQTLVAWYQHHIEQDGYTGTPSFFIDGEQVDNQPYEGFKAILDEKLAQ